MRQARCLIVGIALLAPMRVSGEPITVYDTLQGTDVRGLYIIDSRRHSAVPFVPTASVRLQSVSVVVSLVGEGPNILDMLLMRDHLGFPGEIIETLRVTDGMRRTFDVVDAQSFLQPELVAGSRYYLGLALPDAARPSEAIWASVNGASGVVRFDAYHRVDGSAWSISRSGAEAALRITGELADAPVPEPSTLTLLGATMLLTRRALRRAQSRTHVTNRALSAS